MKKKVLFTILMMITIILPSLAVGAPIKELQRFQTADSSNYLENLNKEIRENQPVKEEQAVEPLALALADKTFEKGNEGVDTALFIKNQRIEEFIQVISGFAERLASKYDLYASVMIAQAILESGAGSSRLSEAPFYNLFGIKGDYEGRSIVMKTQEDDGEGHFYIVEALFRQYPSYEESLEDYARLLKEGLIGNSEFYKGTWKNETNNYQEATTFLTGKYATDIQYAEKLNQLITVYQLTNHDEYSKEEVNKLQKDKGLAIDKLKKSEYPVNINTLRELAN
ncbi:glucosaminidase domain-containing protein [Candidatus Enterococcus lemimoniae]|uniref:Mannosyl-glycoprotein endo-beta-N-acetylglucosamidase-like domain-containing protein n=1 Tax=Candidatus Enterococcus lemimoniae TaxID=1834167 RepID=A0ABZ2T621_9ENTE|nr:glucosaminidase domain-containing protein [Enterococcus sp. 12C11_DIV0727]OTO69191.1 hypothetical protein A5866_001391 [Enterococcus sp. 12C11_DIV0727]